MSSTLSSLDSKNGMVSAEVVGTVVVVGLVVVSVVVSEYLLVE
jgi:hypothetical protein